VQDAAKVYADDKEQLLTTYSQEHGEAGPEKQEHWSTPGINGPADFFIGSKAGPEPTRPPRLLYP